MYIAISDLEKGIQPEILTVITRIADNANNAIAEAVSEVGAYLRARYDMDVEFAKSSSSRNNLVVKLVRDIALYNCYNISNPVNMPESRTQKYKDTISFLKDVQSEKACIDGLERLTNEVGGSSYIRFGGNNKRINHY